MTLEAWVYPTAVGAGSWRNVIIKERPSGEVYNLYANTDVDAPTVYCVLASSPSTPFSASAVSTLPLNNWSHLAATYDGSMLRMYVNGIQAGSRAISGPLLTSTGALRIGGNQVWGEYFQGRIDEVRIYNTALSAAQIQSDMNNPVSAGDTTPPGFSAIVAVNITPTGATITWTTDEPATTQVEYGMTTAYGNLTSINPALILNHSQALTQLVPNTQYHFRVRSVDAAGNLAISQDMTFATAPTMLPQPAAVYVSPSGSDTNPGTEAAPFRTIRRAQDFVRAVNESMTSNVSVYLRGGTYQLSEPVSLTPRDSGSNGFRVQWLAYPGEVPILDGGTEITGWVPEQNGVFSAPTGGLEFLQFYVNGLRGTLARLSNTYRSMSWDVPNQKINIDPIDAAALQSLSPQQLSQVRITILGKGVNQATLRIASISGTAITPMEPERTLIFQQTYPPKENRPYFLDNAFGFVNDPGEFYVDPVADRVYYKPRPGESNMALVTAVASRLERLLSIEGTIDQPVTNIDVSGLTFQHSGWTLPLQTGFIGDQGSFQFVAPLPPDQITSYPSEGLPAAIDVRYAHNLRFERNVIQNAGASAVNFWVDVDDTTFVGNTLRNIAGSGLTIDLNLQGNPADLRIVSRNDIVQNNFVAGIGLDYYYQSVGLQLTYTDSAILEHNEVTNVRYSGISVGWGWADVANAAQGNIIRYNNVYNVVNLMSDGGGIYTLSRQPGTLIAENYVHDILRGPWHGSFPMAAIYLDEGSNFITVRDNVGINVQDTMIHQNVNGPSNTFINNNGTSPTVIANAGLQPAYVDIRVPTARFGTITPNPRNTPVSLLTVQFSEPVNGVDLSDFVLRRNGVIQSLAGVSLNGSGSSYALDLSAATQLAGDYELTLVAAGSGIASLVGYALGGNTSNTWTVDLSAPTVSAVVVGDGSTQRSRISQLKVQFSEIVEFVGAPSAAFILSKQSGGSVAVSVSTSVVANRTESVITFLSDTTFGSLNDGRYTLTIVADQIRDRAGNAMTTNTSVAFHRYFGDANGDSRIDIADFGPFATTYGLNAGQAGFIQYYDYNNDGRIDVADFGQFAIRYFTTLP